MTIKFVDIVRRLYDDQVISFLVELRDLPSSNDSKQGFSIV